MMERTGLTLVVLGIIAIFCVSGLATSWLYATGVFAFFGGLGCIGFGLALIVESGKEEGGL